jgi:hypothetical protein
MTSKSDWKDAYQDLLAEGRKQVEPPAVEDVEKLYRKELTEEDAERVRAQLVYYPDMAKAMTDEQLDADLAAIDPLPFRKRPFGSPAVAIAASVVLVLALGGLYLKLRPDAPPRSVRIQVLDPDGQKGGSSGTSGAPAQPPIQLSTSADYVLKPLFRPQRAYRDYRLELLALDTVPPRSVWSRDGVHREPDGSFPAQLATAEIAPGLYELVLYGVDDSESQRLATYTIRFSAP